MGAAKNRKAEIAQLKTQTVTYKSANGKVINGVFVHTVRKAPAGMKPLSKEEISSMGFSMLAQYSNPSSKVNEMTKTLRAAKVPCMKDDLDQGADIYTLIENSVFIGK